MHEWTALDYRDWLGGIAHQLLGAISGGLASGPVWNELVDKLLDVDETIDESTGTKTIDAKVKEIGPEDLARPKRPSAPPPSDPKEPHA